jgi:hypothetical protein
VSVKKRGKEKTNNKNQQHSTDEVGVAPFGVPNRVNAKHLTVGAYDDDGF